VGRRFRFRVEARPEGVRSSKIPSIGFSRIFAKRCASRNLSASSRAKHATVRSGLQESVQFDTDSPDNATMTEPPRRFPSPWHANKITGGYVVRDANGQELAYIYSRENEAEARQAKVLTADEARRIAINIARLPELLGQADRQHG
jgi:hypothetical protein